MVFVGALPLISASARRRAAGGVLCALVSVVAYREVEPFRRRATNVLGHISQWAILLAYGGALAIEAGLMPRGMSPLLFGLILLGVNLSVICLALALGVKRHLDTFQWHRALTTQEFELVAAVLHDGNGGDDAVEGGRPPSAGLEMMGSDLMAMTPEEAMAVEQNAALLAQHLLTASDVRLLKRVGGGAYGDVFHGACLGQDVAVKTMRIVNAYNVQAFRSEILLTSALRHPNIVAFVGACWSKELTCLVLEWLPRGTLDDLLVSDGLDLHWGEPLLRLARDVARGMAYLHGREYVCVCECV